MSSMACPQCNKVFGPEKSDCPHCRVPLLASIASEHDSFVDEPAWQHTPWGRIVVGLVLAQGLAYGLNLLLKAGSLAHFGIDHSPESVDGFVALRAVQAIGLLFAAVLLGAGLARGPLYGSLLGVVNGLVAIVYPKTADSVSNEWILFGVPVFHLIMGAFGAWLGRTIWSPPPQFLPVEPKRRSLPGPGFQMPAALQGPVYPIRVVICTLTVVWGSICARHILRWIVDASGGLFQQQTGYQERMLAYQLIGLIALFGGGFAGSNTFNGLKQGLCVGLLGAAVFMGLQLARADQPGNTVLILSLAILTLGTLGGMFGGQLFPPVAARRRRSVLDY